MWGATTLVAALMTATAYQVDFLLPYQADSSGKCHNPKREYKKTIRMHDGESVWCCSRCAPGNRLKVGCNETADSVCVRCPSGQYMEGWNYNPQCFSCPKCREDKGLQYLQSCTTSTKSRCMCQPGMYCTIGFDNPYCSECQKYKLCKLGYGVSKRGTAESNVKCSACANGTFSDKVSCTESCKPHTRCQKAVVKQGTTTSDTVCDPPNPIYATTPQHPMTETQSTVVYTTTSPLITSIAMKTDFRPSDPVTVMISNHPATTLPTRTGVKLVVTVVAPIVIGCVMLFIIILVMLWHNIINKKGSQKHDLFIYTNGNCEKVDSMLHKCALDSPITLLAVDPHEQQCLMETQEPCTGPSNAPINL